MNCMTPMWKIKMYFKRTNKTKHLYYKNNIVITRTKEGEEVYKLGKMDMGKNER